MTSNDIPGIKLPQLFIQSPALCKMPWLLITGGRAPAAAWLQELPPVAKLFAADHGLDTCHAQNIRPDYILGDGDSAAPAIWEWGKSLGVPVEEFPAAKDLTDTQLALAKMKNAPAILITGAFGGRFDHLYSLMFSCAHHKVPCIISDEQETIAFVKKDEELTFHFNIHPQAISLLPFTAACTGVTINNVRWPLTNATLTQTFPNAISNELLPNQSKLTVNIKQGILGIYCHWH
ncbi:thiamine diphosphokinase [Selenomonas ruminantium]|uniref:thiamine diphosphokinase n=1 Tax=Selenomonas ruminantium TaxID=971 RepID=UPI00047E523F|nr:thiamine diphosphokinase [Selenomonas ruminantium]